jgi:hypothetical protein
MVIQDLLKYVPEDELSKYSDFIPKQEDNIQIPETDKVLI